jgi:hypothetical protein
MDLIKMVKNKIIYDKKFILDNDNLKNNKKSK